MIHDQPRQLCNLCNELCFSPNLIQLDLEATTIPDGDDLNHDLTGRDARPLTFNAALWKVMSWHGMQIGWHASQSARVSIQGEPIFTLHWAHPMHQEQTIEGWMPLR
ncbi:MAG TPA: hypothetical protein ENH55_19950 [Aurantimonas coralicida]|uniref:Uncharacterized protein n=2 Tax=root TaxID=1 RepID=A0A9C9NG75_9HYPH|nr:hypothetical protein [Aurantimonas coralicida]HEU00714.1 hypothetical protein [Aurantimonas coralicida]